MTDNPSALLLLLERCSQHDRRAQEGLYQTYFQYGMTVCLHYASNYEEAREMFNDGMLRVFTRLGQFDWNQPFRPWLRRVLINAAIDYNRRWYTPPLLPLSDVEEKNLTADNYPALQLKTADVLRMIQQLPASYRTVFNLFVIEGYKHGEIALLLGITEGASKSLYSKARLRLQDMLNTEQEAFKKTG